MNCARLASWGRWPIAPVRLYATESGYVVLCGQNSVTRFESMNSALMFANKLDADIQNGTQPDIYDAFMATLPLVKGSV